MAQIKQPITPNTPGAGLKIKKRLQGYKEQIIGLERDLIALPALGPRNNGQGEYAKALFMERQLKDLSPRTMMNIACPDPQVPQGIRPNLLALFDGQDPSRTIWVLSHLDVVPAGERGLWKSDPFELKVKGDFLYGRGVEDNNHGIVSSYFAVKALREEGITPVHPIGLILVSDEETGSQRGLDYVLKKKRRLFKPQDLIIVPDAGNSQGTMIEIAEKSMLWMKFTLTGKQGHASRPDRAVNTLRATARLITALDRLPKLFNKKDDSFDIPQSTFEPTQKEANVPNINTIPGQDIFYLDGRLLPAYPLKEVIQKIREIAWEVAGKTGTRIKVEVVFSLQAPQPTSPQAPVVQALQRAISAVCHKEARPLGIGGGTVAAFFRQAGLPAAVWCHASDSAHQPNEFCRLSHLIQDAQVFAHVFCRP
jgi:succinyl-diaminopimelate desuccinylase